MVLFDFLSFATEILICYGVEAELSNKPKVVTLNIFWLQAIDGHWHSCFFDFEQLNKAWCCKIVFGTCKMITKTFCTLVDSWGAYAISTYPFLHVLHLCCRYSLFAATIHVPETFCSWVV